jgi:Cof subfamily protein (haloacid dehalogenase superfamily)
MVFYNGATVMEVPSMVLKAATLLPRDIALGCAEIARQRDIHFHVFLSDDRLIYEHHRPEADQYAQRTGLYGEEQDLSALFSEGREASGACIKGMFIAEAPILDSLQVELDRRFDGRLYRARSDSTFLEVMAPGVSKGNGLRIALALRGINPGQTMAFGDAENDIPMLGITGIAVAPENATEEVKKMATLVVPSNDQDGPAQLLENLWGRDTAGEGTSHDR